MAQRKLRTIAAHPGEILRTEFMEPMGITAYQLAKALDFPGVYEIVREQRAITGVPNQRRFCAGWGGISADVALRLGKYFGMTPQVWMNLQADYDLRRAAARAPLSKSSRPRPVAGDCLFSSTAHRKKRPLTNHSCPCSLSLLFFWVQLWGDYEKDA